MIEEDQKTKEILAKVREIEIRARRLVEESLAGQYHSVFKGRGMDFDRAREYVRAMKYALSTGTLLRVLDLRISSYSRRSVR